MDDAAKLDYIASLLLDLHGMAKASNCHFLGYLIEMAVMESHLLLSTKQQIRSAAA